MTRSSHSFGRARWTLLLFFGGMLLPNARALVLGGTTAVQSAAPTDDPGWANVVSPNGCSGVYLGNRWVITAAHVGAGAVTVGGTGYAVQAGSAIRLRTPDAAGVTDLAMFRLVADPGLPTVAVVESQLSRNTAVTMIGFGCTRGEAVSYDSSWVLGGTPAAYTGYQWGAGAKGWGTNQISGTETGNDGYGDLVVYATSFSAASGGGPRNSATTDEAQGAVGDSGGGVFAKVSGAWQLAGIMVTVDAYTGQPGSTALFGNSTYSMELSSYRPQIEAVRALSTGFDIWGYANFRATVDATADPDGDGFSNLLEYAYGLDPQTANAASAAPQVALATYADGDTLTATFTQNTVATDVAVDVEVSEDLVTWNSGAGFTTVVSSTSVGTNVVQLVVRDLLTTATSGRRFMRVKVAR